MPDAADANDPGLRPPQRGHSVEDAGYPALAEWHLEMARPGSVISSGTRFILAGLVARLGRRNRSVIGDDLAALLGGASMCAYPGVWVAHVHPPD